MSRDNILYNIKPNWDHIYKVYPLYNAFRRNEIVSFDKRIVWMKS